jgi:NAD(P)-dependent dehydrogenase (short-subunit alcohol dehydrogenase family)
MNVEQIGDFGRARASDYSGQVVLISNVCDEIGAGVARDLASMNAIVGLCGVDKKVLESLFTEITDRGGRAIALPISTAEAVSEVVDDVYTRIEKIDILVNNLGATADCAIAELSVHDFKNNIDSSLVRSFAFLREVVARMRSRGYGRIINITDLSYLGLAKKGNLAAAHAAIFGLTRSIALETAPAGITVNTLVKGDMSAADMSVSDAEKIAKRIPVKRIGTVADIVHAINFFSAKSTAYVTGQTLFVCGGMSAYFSMSV